MFNKNNAYLHLPQPFHSAAATADEILFHHHDDILSGHYFAASAAPVVDAAAFYHNHQDPSGLINADLSSLANTNTCPKTTKKDRHSKIYTSQGPRDRRVRLSIGVARRFFDLQEILGFDKPSKTLDWLLTNSKTAIKDLMQTKETENAAAPAPVPSSPSECEEADSETGNFFGISPSDSKRKLSDRKCISISDHATKALPSASDLVKESRVKARARARERTREKMCIKQLHEDFNQLEFPSSSNNFHSHPGYEASTNDHQDLIQIKRKVKHFISTSNYGVPSPNYNINPSENWDICAILDSHKFIHSTSDN